MAPTAKTRPHWRTQRAFWVLIVGGLVLAALAPWGIARAVGLLDGPSVILPGSGYRALAVTPNGRTLYAADAGPDGDDGHTVTPINVGTGKAGTPISVGNAPQGLVVTPDGRMLYALLSDGRITPVNLGTGRAVAQIKIRSGASAITVSPDGATLYVGASDNKIVADDTATGRLGTPIPLPIPLPAPASGPTVTPDAMTVTPDGKTLYVADSDDTVIPVDLASGRPGTPISVGNPELTTPLAIALASNARTLYVAVNGDYGGGSGPNSLVAIDTATNAPGKAIAYGPGPIKLAVAPDRRTVYALNGNYGNSVTDASTVIPVSAADGRPGAAIRTGGLFSHASASGLAIAPDGRVLYVAEGDVVAIELPRSP